MALIIGGLHAAWTGRPCVRDGGGDQLPDRVATRVPRRASAGAGGRRCTRSPAETRPQPTYPNGVDQVWAVPWAQVISWIGSAAVPPTVTWPSSRPLSSTATAVWLCLCGSIPTTTMCMSPSPGVRVRPADTPQSGGRGLVLRSSHAGRTDSGRGARFTRRPTRPGGTRRKSHPATGADLPPHRRPGQRDAEVHANAPLSERGRLRLARLIVDDGWPIARSAERMQVSWPTAKRWADRYEQLEPAGMVDRSSRPHRSPRATPAPVVRRIVHLRWKQRLGPVAIGDRVGVAPSTVHRVLTRCRISRLCAVDRVSGKPVRRYEHPAPGDPRFFTRTPHFQSVTHRYGDLLPFT